VDVTPTVLGLIGEAERIPALGEIDGINLADELRKAR
jgi:arylsulfatase A-like enzyme